MGFTADVATKKTFSLGGHPVSEIRFARALERPLPAVRRLAAHEWPLYRALRLQALADSPDAFGSTFAAENALRDEDWAARLARGARSETDLPLVAEVDGVAAGLAWARFADDAADVAHLYQMWVSPAFRGAGAGRRLLDMAIDWARNRGLRTLVLGVTCGDTPAARLYARAGFQPVGPPAPLRPGSALLGQTLRLALDA
jgi:ribosomal protein S18 acetylase RimI-like enzyme